jgi:hypothetical protein
MTTPQYTLYVRDSSLARVAQIDDWQRFELTMRFNRAGSWTLELPPDSAPATLLLADGAGLVIVRDGVTLSSGPRLGRVRARRPEANTLTLPGTNDMIWLARRLAYPVPAGPPYSGAEYDVRTGVAETIIREYVNLNAGPGAAVARRVAGLTLAADGGLGTSVTGRARFDNLLEFIASLALQGGDLGFDVVQSGSDLVFSVYEPRDMTASAVFSLALGNLQGFAYNEQAAGANYVICGGEGEGTARTFAEGSDATSVAKWGRIETFIDYRKTTDAGELGSAVTEELERQAERFTASVDPIDTAGMAFMTHWQLGDRVTLLVDDVELQAMVREVKIVVDRDGRETVTPVLGTPGVSSENLLDMIVKSGALRPRVGLMERR